MKKKSIWCLAVCFLLFMSSCSLWESKDFFLLPSNFKPKKKLKLQYRKIKFLLNQHMIKEKFLFTEQIPV